MGRAIASQAKSYARSYGRNEEYEVLVAEIYAKLLCADDLPTNIAESPSGMARSHGFETRLVTHCIRFAQGAGLQAA